MSGLDLVIRNGLVCDGTGAEPVHADVGIAAGRIAAVGGDLDGPELDASDLIVAPGFIDLHTHYDAQVMWDRHLTPTCWHGVTSLVMGNCGFSIAPLRSEDRRLMFETLERAEDMGLETLEQGVTTSFETYDDYLSAIEAGGTLLNVGGYVGHTAVRIYVMGDDAYERPATPEEIARMKEVVAASIRAGALGFSSSCNPGLLGSKGRPLPSVIADHEELLALAHVPSEIGQGIVAHSPGNDLAWLYEFARDTGTPVTWTSILTFPAGTVAFKSWSDKLAEHRAGRSLSDHVWPQVTCRPMTFQVSMDNPGAFSRAPLFRQLQAATRAERFEAYRSTDWRRRAAAELDSLRFVNPRWASFYVDEDAPADLVGLSAAQLAERAGSHPLDVVLDLALDRDLRPRFRVVLANDDEAALYEILTTEGCVLGLSDAGAHVGQMCDAALPTDFLAGWVRDRGLMSLPQGIRKLTGELADVYALAGRGYLRPGGAADVVLLDLDAVDPGPVRRVSDLPAGGSRLVADRPRGIEHVLVNGTPTFRRGELLVEPGERLPGQLLRSQPRGAGVG